MTVNRPHAVIDTHGSKYHPANRRSPEGWEILLIGRETPQRIYRVAEPTRWGYDPFFRKSEVVVARFDTAEEAKAYIDKAKAFMAAELREKAEAVADSERVRNRLREADEALLSKAKAFAAIEG